MRTTKTTTTFLATPMGSIPSPPQPAALPPSPDNSYSNYRVYASFCPREPSPNTSISNWIECYDPLDNAWSYVDPIPGLPDNHVLKGFAMVSVGCAIYIIGGRLCRKVGATGAGGSGGSGGLNDLVEVDTEVLSSVSRYDVDVNQWFNCAPLIIPRYDFACTVGENKIYVAGGQSTLASARGISSAEVYDPNLNKWTTLPNMSTPRYKCVGVTWQGKIHVVGGFGDPVPFIFERSSAEVFDTRSGKWDLVAGMWQLDVPPNQIVAVGGRLFSSGDCLNAWKGHIEAYDGKLGIWNIIEGSNLDTVSSPLSTRSTSKETWPQFQRLYLTMAPIGTHLYFLAGYRMAGELSRMTSMVHTFNTSVNGDYAWRSFEPVEEEGEKELCSHCCVVQLSRNV